MKFSDGDAERAVLTGQMDILDAWALSSARIEGSRPWESFDEVTRFRKVPGRGEPAPLTLEEARSFLEKRYALIPEEEKQVVFAREKPYFI